MQMGDMVEGELHGKNRSLLFLGLVELLIMSVWFSASAVVPQLAEEWHLTGGESAWMTMSVQLGFVVGGLTIALFNLADRIRVPLLIALSGLLASLFTLAIPLAVDGPAVAILLRFCTGMMLAGAYPPAMRIVATWTTIDRGAWIGFLVGGLTVGSAFPHLLGAIPIFNGPSGLPPWRYVLIAASILALLASVIVLSAVHEGPLLSRPRQFNWRYAVAGLRNRPLRLVNIGYFGHMWELYAMWAWAPLCIYAAYDAHGWDLRLARLAGFGTVAIGGVGCVIAGRLADRIGRTTITIASLMLSGVCSLIAGFFFPFPLALTGICLIWGFAVVADSAQFSTAITELSDPEYVGTTLAVQTALGFLLTVVTLRAVPILIDRFGWRWTFPFLAIGPVVGMVSMYRLRGLPEAERMASGNR